MKRRKQRKKRQRSRRPKKWSPPLGIAAPNAGVDLLHVFVESCSPGVRYELTDGRIARGAWMALVLFTTAGAVQDSWTKDFDVQLEDRHAVAFLQKTLIATGPYAGIRLFRVKDYHVVGEIKFPHQNSLAGSWNGKEPPSVREQSAMNYIVYWTLNAPTEFDPASLISLLRALPESEYESAMKQIKYHEPGPADGYLLSR